MDGMGVGVVDGIVELIVEEMMVEGLGAVVDGDVPVDETELVEIGDDSVRPSTSR